VLADNSIAGSYMTRSLQCWNMCCRYVEIFKSSMMEAESAIAMQGKYIPGVGATGGAGGGRPTPYERSRGRGMRGSMRGRGAGNIKGVMGMYAGNCINVVL